MMKKEFEDLLGTHVLQTEYDVIEQVYMYYDDTKSKKDFVLLYKMFGLKIFKDMLPRAMAIKEVQDELFVLQSKKEAAQDRVKALLEGADFE